MNRSHKTTRKLVPLGLGLLTISVIGVFAPASSSKIAGGNHAVVARTTNIDASASIKSFLREHPQLNHRALPIASIREKLGGNGGEASGDILNGPAQEAYENRAYPKTYIGYDRVMVASHAAATINSRAAIAASAEGVRAASAPSWSLLGPTTGNVPGAVTYTGRPTTNAGRTTALAVAPRCVPGDCRVWVGAAGGGVWRTDDALAMPPHWTPSSNGLASNAIGSIVLDPNDATGQTLYYYNEISKQGSTVNLQSYACSTDCAVATMRIKLSIGPQITLAVVSYSRYLVVILCRYRRA